MPFNIIPFEEFKAQADAAVRRVNPDIDPTVYGSFAYSYNTAGSALAYSVQYTQVDLSKQLFPQTATGEFLDLWAGYEILERLPATSAFGLMAIAGDEGTIIPVLTIFRASNGLDYESQSVSTVTVTSKLIQSLTRVGNIVTATLPDDHNLASGLNAEIAGAVETEYNGVFQITVIERNKFTYEIETSPTTPATGTITYESTFASVDLKCVDVGQVTNIGSGAIFTPSVSISGLESTGFAQIDGMSGGAEVESDDLLRGRVLLSRSIIEGVFTPDQIKLAALSIAGNTRVFVIKPQMSVAAPVPAPGTVPAPGQVYIYILRDNDENIVPTQTILNQTKTAIIELGKLPAHSSAADVFVYGPITVQTDFELATLVPDTPTMRTAVTDQLTAFFEDTVSFQQSVTEASYLGAIQNTQDLQTGDILVSFSLNAPTGDITIGAGEIAVLGEVSFP